MKDRNIEETVLGVDELSDGENKANNKMEKITMNSNFHIQYVIISSCLLLLMPIFPLIIMIFDGIFGPRTTIVTGYIRISMFIENGGFYTDMAIQFYNFVVVITLIFVFIGVVGLIFSFISKFVKDIKFQKTVSIFITVQTVCIFFYMILGFIYVNFEKNNFQSTSGFTCLSLSFIPFLISVYILIKYFKILQKQYSEIGFE